MTRTAISPRLAMRIFLNRTDGKKSLPVLYRLAVHHEPAFHDARCLSLNLIHEFHGLDDAQYLSGLDALAHAHKRRRARRGRFIESADDGRFDQSKGRVGTTRLGRWLVDCGRGRVKGRNSRRSGSMNSRNRTSHEFLGIGKTCPPDADAVFAPL